MHRDTPSLLRQTALEYADKKAYIRSVENERLTYLEHKTETRSPTQKYPVSDCRSGDSQSSVITVC